MHTKHARRNESGVALLITVLLLALMGIAALSSMETVMRDKQVAGIQSQARASVYAADAGLARSFGILRQSIADNTWPQSVAGLLAFEPNLPESGVGDANDYPGGNTPVYRADPDSGGTPIDFLGFSPVCPDFEASINMANYGSGSGPRWAVTLWHVQVEGQAPGGATTGLQGLGGRCQGMDQG